MKTVLEAMHNLKETIEYEKDYQAIFSEIDLKDIGSAVYDCIKGNKLGEAAVQVILNRLKLAYNVKLENCNKLKEDKNELDETAKFKIQWTDKNNILNGGKSYVTNKKLVYNDFIEEAKNYGINIKILRITKASKPDEFNIVFEGPKEKSIQWIKDIWFDEDLFNSEEDFLNTVLVK